MPTRQKLPVIRVHFRRDISIMRCLECGQLCPEAALHCPVCHSPQARGGGPTPPYAVGEPPPRLDLFPDGASPEQNAGVGPPWQGAPPAPWAPANTPRVRRSPLTGRVIAVDGPHIEAPDFDPARVLSRMLWMLLALLTPFALGVAAWQQAGPIAALLVGGFFLIVMRWLSPANLFAIFHLAVLLNPLGRRAPDGQPVRYLRIRDQDSGEEHIVRVKGLLSSGNVLPDDLLSLWGPWRGGVLHARAAYNHRTHAAIPIDRRRAWGSLLLVLLAALALAAVLAEPLAAILDASARSPWGGTP